MHYWVFAIVPTFRTQFKRFGNCCLSFARRELVNANWFLVNY